MVGLDVTYYGAFIAGLLSFLSPCILPIVPPYLCFLGGVTLEQLQEGEKADREATRRVILASLMFVLGFATIFVGFGASASLIGRLLLDNLDVLSVVAGILIIILGLHFLGLFKIALLYRDVRFRIEKRPAGLIGAYVIGLAFAFGWTPCVGPVLAAIMMIAGSQETTFQGASLMAAYAVGIGLPFIGAAFFSPLFLRLMQRFRRHMAWVERVLGGFLILTGILFITGDVNEIANWLLTTFPSLGSVG